MAFPAWGWAGLGVLIVAHAGVWLQGGAWGEIFPPLLWTGLLLLVDAAVQLMRRRSLLAADPAALSWAAVISIFLCSLLEGLNGTLPVWSWLGWPASELPYYAALGWHFATYVPWLLVIAQAIGLDWADERGLRRPWFRAAAGLAALAVAAWLAGQTPGPAFLAALFGLTLIGDARNAWAGDCSLGRQPRLFAALAAASLARYALERLWLPGAAAGGYFVAPEGPGLAGWGVGVLLGPTLFVFYVGVASIAGLPAGSACGTRPPAKENLNLRLES